MNETIGHILIGVGVAFDLFGCLGLVRLPDVYNRLQAGTKCVTLGTCLILVGVAVAAGLGEAALLIKALLCACFILLTSPVGAHALARGAYRSGVPLCTDSVVDAYAHSPAMRKVESRRHAGQSPTAQESRDAQAEAP